MAFSRGLGVKKICGAHADGSSKPALRTKQDALVASHYM
jgi:hypothetical protein